METVAVTVFALAALLGLGSLLLPLAGRLHLPYTVMLAGFGSVLGLVVINDMRLGGLVGDLFGALGQLGLSSEAFIHLFLPALLFHAGLTIDVRRLMDDLWPVVILAVVAVLVCTVVIGLPLAAASGMGVIACLLVAAIVATTDSAAIVAIFRDIGAPGRLTIIVEGESLFNDAAAIAVFALLLSLLADPLNVSLGMGAVKFIWGLAGGLGFGYFAGRVFSWLIGTLRNAPVSEITLTLTLAYTTFYVCETYIQCSGVVAVVTGAMVMGSEGRTRLSPGGWANLVTTWRQLDFWATSLIFMLAAMLVPRVMAEATWRDLGYVAIVFAAALGARGLVLYGLMPGLSVMGLAAPISSRYKAVLLWGGMRGAVTVALALAVSENAAIAPEIQRFVLVVATGFTLATLLLMAPTLRPLIRTLRLNRLNPREQFVRDRVMALARAQVDKRVETFAKEVGLPRAPVGPALGEGGLSEGPDTSSEDELVEVGLLTLANREAALYLDYYQNGIVDRAIVERLGAHAGRLKDAVKAGGLDGYREGGRRYVAFTNAFRHALWLQRSFGFEKPLRVQIAVRFEVLLVQNRALEHLSEHVEGTLRPLLGDSVAARLLDFLGRRREQVHGALEALELQYPAFADILRERYVERVGITLEESEYREQMRQAVIPGEVFADLTERLDQRRRALERRPPLDLGFRLRQMMAKLPFFAEADEEDLARIARRLRPQLAVPGENIITKGELGDRMYFLATGEVEVVLPGQAITLRPGEFFGELALLDDAPRSADVRARSYCNLLVLSRRDFRRLLNQDPALKAQIERVAAGRRTVEEPLAAAQ